MSSDKSVKSLSATQVALNVFRERGFRGFYQGGTATLTRDVFFSAIYFPMFAYFNQQVIIEYLYYRLKYVSLIFVNNLRVK